MLREHIKQYGPGGDSRLFRAHAGVSLWINAGVDPVEVARPAGHSIAVLFPFCRKILRGQQDRANQSNQLFGRELSSNDEG
ncbi:hypothetical protein [Streptomyces atratus]|uniref:hypothetical protein n=1 Tax=Streptomyces TaxID=1883 RepID=UPI0037A81836